MMVRLCRPVDKMGMSNIDHMLGAQSEPRMQRVSYMVPHRQMVSAPISTSAHSTATATITDRHHSPPDAILGRGNAPTG
jgi:hypothetical protein